MAKQTNPFQQVVTYVHEEFEGTGAKVTESAILYEEINGVKIGREIDVLVERKDNGKVIRMAVECRDRGKKDDIEWVDSLVGKFINLGLDKVIAVSNSGFSKSAKIKAQRHGIILCELENATAIDFKTEFVQIGLSDVKFELKIFSWAFDFNPPVDNAKLSPDTKVFVGDQTMDLNALVQYLVSESISRHGEEFKKQAFGQIKTMADFYQRFVVINTIPFNGFHQIKLDSNSFHVVKSVTLNFVVEFTPKDIELKHKKYLDALVSGAKPVSDEGAKEIIYIVQRKGKAKVFKDIGEKKNKKSTGPMKKEDKKKKKK